MISHLFFYFFLLSIVVIIIIITQVFAVSAHIVTYCTEQSKDKCPDTVRTQIGQYYNNSLYTRNVPTPCNRLTRVLSYSSLNK